MENLKPLSLVYNQKSGFHANHKDDFYEQIMTLFSRYGFEIQVFELNEQCPIDMLMPKILTRHKNSQNKGVIVGAGGDGTLNAIASYLMHTDIPLGILPLGTFNYVARVLDIPIHLIRAADVIATGQIKSVHVAKLNDYIYLNNASLGLYPLFIEQRERYNKYFGRFPLHAYTSAIDVLIRKYRSLKLEVTVDGVRYPVNTALVFFGNNQLQLKELNLKIADSVKAGKIGGVVVAQTDRLSLVKLLIKLVQGDIEKANEIYSFSADHVEVTAKKGHKLYLAIDGELVEEYSPLRLSVEKNALNIMVPHVTSSL